MFWKEIAGLSGGSGLHGQQPQSAGRSTQVSLRPTQVCQSAREGYVQWVPASGAQREIIQTTASTMVCMHGVYTTTMHAWSILVKHGRP